MIYTTKMGLSQSEGALAGVKSEREAILAPSLLHVEAKGPTERIPEVETGRISEAMTEGGAKRETEGIPEGGTGRDTGGILEGDTGRDTMGIPEEGTGGGDRRRGTGRAPEGETGGGYFASIKHQPPAGVLYLIGGGWVGWRGSGGMYADTIPRAKIYFIVCVTIFTLAHIHVARGFTLSFAMSASSRLLAARFTSGGESWKGSGLVIVGRELVRVGQVVV